MINRLLNRFAQWAIARAPKPNEPQPLVFGYTIEDYADGSPYLTRILLPRVFGVRPMIHKFHRPDGDRALHNHPWTWMVSVILRGSYTEERRLEPEEINGTDAPATQTRRVRWFNVLTDKTFHRVAELHGEVWSLFITGPRVQDWGFKEDPSSDHVEPWRQYIDRKRAELATAQTSKALYVELEQACGDALDRIGQVYNVRRKATVKIDHKTHITSYDWVQPDEDYRTAIRRVLSGPRGVE